MIAKDYYLLFNNYMELYKLKDYIYYSDYEEERDRPSIGYILGDNFSVAIDAGHSKEHLDEFYEALKENNLPLPSLTIITHWHWDHSFAMHCINGLSIANKRTNQYLKDFIKNRSEENDYKFLHLDPSITKEYLNQELIVVPCDIEFEKELVIDLGNTKLKLFEAVSSHTDDSTLIYLEKEKVLFFGDAMSGVFPTWIRDPKLRDEFYNTINKLDVEYCLGGHWKPFKKEELLKELFID